VTCAAAAFPRHFDHGLWTLLLTTGDRGRIPAREAQAGVDFHINLCYPIERVTLRARCTFPEIGMDIVSILWDLDDEPDGNVQHVGEHGLTTEEVDSVLLNPTNEVDESHSSGLTATFGWTHTGRHIIVIWENVLDDPQTVYPVTAYEVPPRGADR
jgi:hypothetical protein